MRAQVPPDSAQEGDQTLAAGTIVTVSEIKGGRCLAKSKGWVDLADLEWEPESIALGAKAKFLKICGRKKRALVLDQPGMPWVWSESLEGILKFSEYVDDICVGFDGPAVWLARGTACPLSRTRLQRLSCGRYCI
eukprot:COSAG01_NODE_5498_length_4224_cov_2.723152_6_plen_135_part_00